MVDTSIDMSVVTSKKSIRFKEEIVNQRSMVERDPALAQYSSVPHDIIRHTPSFISASKKVFSHDDESYFDQS